MGAKETNYLCISKDTPLGRFLESCIYFGDESVKELNELLKNADLKCHIDPKIKK